MRRKVAREPSPGMPSSRSVGVPQRRPRQLNPAFANARQNKISSHNAQQTQTKKVDAALRQARSTGRLNLSSCSLSSLPLSMFDLRHHIEIDLSMDMSSNPGSWQSYSEEEVTHIDLSDNLLDKFTDKRLEKFVSLRSLRLKRCDLMEVNWTSIISRYDNLQVLDVSGNSLTGAHLECLPTTVREVDLSANKITRLTRTIEESDNEPAIVLPYLVRLDISNNQLNKLPSLMEVPALQTLVFSNNQIEEFPSDLLDQCAMSTLEGSHNRLQRVPDLSGYGGLRIVDFSDNILREIPAVGPDVVRMNLNNNSLSSLSGLFSGAQIGSDAFRSDLTELLLQGNKMQSLDQDVVRCLTKLTLLDVAMNDLRDLPGCLGYLSDLRRICVEGNALRAIRTEVASNTSALKKLLRKRGPAPPGKGYMNEEVDEKASCDMSSEGAKHLVNSALVGTFTLDMSSSKLDGLPDYIQNELDSARDDSATAGGQIKKLVISKNSLNQIDDWLQAMPNLKSITATQNRIDSLPSNIAKYSLVELILPRNALTSSAISIIGDNPKSNLGMHLTCIDLSGNNLEWFSSSLAKLPLLSTLAMSRNRIQTLAAGLENGLESGWREGFQALEMLDLSCNKISDIGELPRCLIEYCPRIRDLSLSNNELAFIPPDFCVLQSLTFLDLRGNPQRAIRPGVLDRSTPEILSYLQSRIDSEKLHKLQEKRTKSSAADGDKKNGSSKNDSECKSNRLEELRKEIDKATLQLNNVHLTEAKKYAIKKSLKTLKASLIKEERHIRMEAGN